MEEKPLPLVSILIATYNEAKYIEQCLTSLLQQDYPIKSMEVLVIDGCSSDDTQPRVLALAKEHPQIRLLTNHRRIQVCAFNLGARQARGDVVFIMSAHAKYDRQYVHHCVELLQDTGAANVGGVWEIAPGEQTLLARSIAMLWTTRFGVGGARFRMGGEAGPVDTVSGGAYRRAVFQQVGYLDERLVRGEDNEFNARIRQHGMVIYFDPRIRSLYFARPTLGAFLKQLFGNGYYHFATLRVNRGGCSIRHFIPGVFVATLLASALAGLFWWPGWLGGAAALGFYFLADSGASIKVAAKNGWSYLLTMPWLYFLAHMTYGIGTLVGMVRYGLDPRFGPSVRKRNRQSHEA